MERENTLEEHVGQHRGSLVLLKYPMSENVFFLILYKTIGTKMKDVCCYCLNTLEKIFNLIIKFVVLYY